MVAWWTSRSIRAAATMASPRISPHCSKPRFEVAARKQHGYTGAGKAATNGWTFWRFTAADGAIKLLNELRVIAA
jgi:hypothetical protein